MKYSDFEKIMSRPRMYRYVTACLNDTKKAMTLYWLNLKLSQELFTIISCFEIALRNAIDYHYTAVHGNEWLLNSISDGSIFDNNSCRTTKNIIIKTYNKLNRTNNYSHFKLIAEMDFGFWRYLFSQPQFYAGGQSLLRIFPAKPISTVTIQYNQSYVFNELGKINDLRNRIAHHEPICFSLGTTNKDTTYVKQNYRLIKDLFNWMQIDEASLLYGLNHVNQIVQKIDNL